MAMLNFKYGQYRDANGIVKLPEAISNGTVYVTTDEKAMYVDLDNKRIRLSQIVTCTMAEWQALTPPYNAEAFYYIIDKNALLKYNEGKPDAGYSAGWVQINSTAGVEAELSTLKGTVNTMSSDVEGLKTASASQGSAIETLQNTVNNTHATAITGLQNRATNIEASLANVGTVIGYKGSYAAGQAPENPAINDVILQGGAIKIYDGTNWKDYADIVDQIEQLKADMETLEGKVPDNSQYNDLKARVEALETWKTDTVTQALADLVAADGAMDTRVKAVEDAITHETTGLAALDTAVKAAAQAASDAAGVAANNKAAIEDGTTGLAALKSAIDGVKNTADTNKATIENADTGLAKAHSRIDTLEQSISGEAGINKQLETIKGDLASVKSTADTTAAAVNNETTGLGAAHSRIDDLEDADDALGKRIDGVSNTLTGVSTTASNALEKANDNAGLIAGLDSELDAEVLARQNAITALQNEITSKMQTADAMAYQKTVAKADELPTVADGIKKGYTYKAADEFVLDDTQVYIGDLIIATGTEDAITGLITTLDWEVVPSGFVADYNPELSVVAGSTNSVALKLTSGAPVADGDLGTIQIAAAEDSPIKITTDDVAINISMQWSQF